MKTPTPVRAAALAASFAVTLALAQAMSWLALPPGPPDATLLAHASVAQASTRAAP